MLAHNNTNFTASVHQSDEMVSISVEDLDDGMLTTVYVTGNEVAYTSSDAEGTTCSMSGRNSELADTVREALVGIRGSGMLRELINQVQVSLLMMGPKPRHKLGLVTNLNQSMVHSA